ncbi:hypothetical protein VB780_09330 [Leptolyngbya sp. CCNP1308]|uniref:hypothetical protein n=1 Tax=Leptolyngbya sp. CCNP1308 TaxID=3110255 RepID=UPI002B21169F|nr:hypothetical protein [Leptolyngbya sp. CCNP1308]MEA5448767.1 hypothetical protein [Leptolyngbya sp. CCNP1308]
MQTLKRIFNPSAWRQWMVVFLAGLVVLTTTACGATQAAVPVDNNSATAVSPKSEGMYPHKDTDMDTRAADAKADRMIRQAEQRIEQNSNKSLGQQAEEVGQSAKRAAENIGQSTQQAADNAAENARGLVNGAADTVLPNS